MKTPIYRIPHNNQHNADVDEHTQLPHIKIYTDGSLVRQNRSMGAAAIFVINERSETGYIPFLAKPTPGNISSEKAELTAIYMALVLCHSEGYKYSIYTDSQSSIDAIANITKQPLTTRNALKMANYQLLQLIKHQLYRIQTPVEFVKVKAHTGDRFNEIADQQASNARTGTAKVMCIYENTNYPTQVLDRLSLYDDNTIVDIYPRKIIKTKYLTNLQRKNNAYIKQRWANREYEEENINVAVDWSHTIKIAGSKYNLENPLDSRHTDELNFRIRNILNMLPISDRLYRHGIITREEERVCPQCEAERADMFTNTATPHETHHHLYECLVTKSRYNTLRSQTKAIMTRTWLNKENPLPNKLAEYILQKLSFTNKPATELNKHFLHSAQARGIVTVHLRQSFASDCRLKQMLYEAQGEHPNYNRKSILTFAINCYLTAAYQNIWIPRCAAIKARNQTADEPEIAPTRHDQIVEVHNTVYHHNVRVEELDNYIYFVPSDEEDNLPEPTTETDIEQQHMDRETMPLAHEDEFNADITEADRTSTSSEDSIDNNITDTPTEDPPTKQLRQKRAYRTLEEHETERVLHVHDSEEYTQPPRKRQATLRNAVAQHTSTNILSRPKRKCAEIDNYYDNARYNGLAIVESLAQTAKRVCLEKEKEPPDKASASQHQLAVDST